MAGDAPRGGEGLTLLGLWPSPFVIRARIALNLKRLTYVYTDENLFDKSELLLKSNSVRKKVPVLIHDGKPVCESQNIVQYIDEAFPAAAGGGGTPILPSHPYDRAVARFWASYVEDKLFRTWVPVFRGRTAEERVQAATQVVPVLQTLEQAFKECSKGKPFFGGDTVGFVDVVLGGHLGWLYATEAICGVKVVDATKTPLLVAWAERLCALDAVKGLIPDVDRLVEYNMTSTTGELDFADREIAGEPASGCRCCCRTLSCSRNKNIKLANIYIMLAPLKFRARSVTLELYRLS